MKPEELMTEMMVATTQLRVKLVASDLKKETDADEMLKKNYTNLLYALDEVSIYAERIRDLVLMKGGKTCGR